MIRCFLMLLLMVAYSLVASSEQKKDFPLAEPLGLSETYPIDLYPDLRLEIDQKWNSLSPQQNVQRWQSRIFPWEGVFVLLGLLLIIFCLKRMPRKPVFPKVMPFSEQRYQKAEEYLQQLQHSQYDNGIAKAYLAALADSVRAAIQERYQMKVNVKTTEEFFASLDTFELLKGEKQSELKNFMQKADLVKFAAEEPSLSECLEAKKAAATIFDLLKTT